MRKKEFQITIYMVTSRFSSSVLYPYHIRDGNCYLQRLSPTVISHMFYLYRVGDANGIQNLPNVTIACVIFLELKLFLSLFFSFFSPLTYFPFQQHHTKIDNVKIQYAIKNKFLLMGLSPIKHFFTSLA